MNESSQINSHGIQIQTSWVIGLILFLAFAALNIDGSQHRCILQSCLAKLKKHQVSRERMEQFRIAGEFVHYPYLYGYPIAFGSRVSVTFIDRYTVREMPRWYFNPSQFLSSDLIALTADFVFWILVMIGAVVGTHRHLRRSFRPRFSFRSLLIAITFAALGMAVCRYYGPVRVILDFLIPITAQLIVGCGLLLAIYTAVSSIAFRNRPSANNTAVRKLG